MKRILAGIAFGSIVIFGATSFAGAVVTPKTKSTALRYFSKNVTSDFTNAAGTSLPANASPAVGDQFLSTDNDYRGSSTHYGKSLVATDALHCTFNTVTKTTLIGQCVGVISIGNSLLISISTQNLADNSPTTVYPITAGTGIFNGATGRVVTTSIGKTNNSDFTIQVNTP